MAEIVLNKLINEEIDENNFLQWLFKQNHHSQNFSKEYNCSRAEFVTFFLNFIHEDVASSIKENKITESNLNKSKSFPLDSSSELDESLAANSTPKLNKSNSEHSISSYCSPVSPIYKPQITHNNSRNKFITPQKSPICLGDFVITRKNSSNKKKTARIDNNVKRIKSTNVQLKSFVRSENSFNFSKSETEEFPSQRNFLMEERLKILSRNDLQQSLGNSNIFTQNSFENTEIKASVESVHCTKKLDTIIKIYTGMLNHNLVLNLTSEIHFLVTLLLKKQFCKIDLGVSLLKEQITPSELFTSLHNLVYFACKCLETQASVIKTYDNTTIRQLIENERIIEFAPNLTHELIQKTKKLDRIVQIRTIRDNVCFNSDTDNRQNFPNDPSFHAFRKQRDLFYEILRLWEQHHLSPGFNFSLSLGGKIKSLISLYNEPTNYIHFSRLFKSQLLSTCHNTSDNVEKSENFITSFEVDAQKLLKLKNRCVTKETGQGLNSLPKFSESEEFYREFIVVAASHCFNRHLADSLIEDIVELNDTNFNISELDDNEVDLSMKKAFFNCIRSLRLLAKFLGFVESIPYKTECRSYSEELLSTHLKIRQQKSPSFDIKTILHNSIRRKSVILCIPWLVKYLSMLDYVTLKLPYYTIVHHNLFWLYRNFDWAPNRNIFLVKFCLGWFFELPHIPDNNYLYFCEEIHDGFNDSLCGTEDTTLDQLEIVNQDILYFCCPYLDEIKKLLSSTASSNALTVKHITPVTAVHSPDELARKKLEQQLEDAFFNGQPISLRKTVEFVSERVASTCVKFVCSTIVPNHKKHAIEKLRQSLTLNPDEDINIQKAALKQKASQLAETCLIELQQSSKNEVERICTGKIPSAIDSLLSLDILSQTKEVCIGITKRSCIDRVQQWLTSHVTLGVFSKDFNDEIQKFTNMENRRAKRPVFMLPPGGTNENHNAVTTSAAHLLEKYQDLCVLAVEGSQIPEDVLVDLLDDTIASIDERGDINQCILATLCTLLLDLFLLMFVHNSNIVTHDEALSKSIQIWKLYFNGCEDLFKSLLCPRNVKMFAHSKNKTLTWNAFAQFCVVLINNNMLSCDNFESQCTGIFRTEWDQENLKLITEFLKTFVEMYKQQGSGSDFTLLLDFLADYCEDL